MCFRNWFANSDNGVVLRARSLVGIWAPPNFHWK